MSNKIGESSEDKKIFGTIFSRKPSLRDDKWCRRIFFYLLKYGPSRPTKIEDYFEKEYEDVGIKKINVRRTISEKLLKHNIVVKVPTESDAVLYDLSEEFKAITFDQWRHFEKMREVFEPHLWGYLGRGGMNEFMANHTTYGFPTPNELSNYERDMALMAMKMIDTGFRSLQEVKFLTEIKKELAEQNNSEGELPENLFSFRLTLEYMTFFVSRYLKKMAHHSDNPDEFFEKVKDASLKILQESPSGKF